MTDEILVVGVDSTGGWSLAVQAFAQALRDAGASVRVVGTGPVPQVRTFMLTDLTQAWLARRATERGIAEAEPAAIVYCSMTAALLWPRPGAIWVDSIAAENRPGRHGVWQRLVERRRLRQAPLLLTFSETSLAPLAGRDRPESIVVPCPIHPANGTPQGERDVAAVTYAGNPAKKRMEFVLGQWGKARRDGERLLVAGVDQIPEDAPAGVEPAGRLSPQDYRALLRRTRVFVAAPTREDYGIAPLEALSDGCILATTPAPGPYPARELARRLDPRLVSDDLAGAIRTALDDPLPGYAERAAELLRPFGPAAVDATLRDRVIPRLLVPT